MPPGSTRPSGSGTDVPGPPGGAGAAGVNAPPPPPENAAAALACDPDPSPRSNGGHSNGGAHRGDAYHVTPGPGGSLRGGSAFVVVEDARGDALAGAPWVAHVRAYLRKAGSGLDSALPLPAPLDALISTLGAFLGIAAVAGLDTAIRGGEASSPEDASSPLPLLIYSFGASAVLIYGLPESKLSQPRNVIGGQVVSALVGAAVRLALGSRVMWVTSAAGMALALTAMEALSVVHPPGGATALIASSARVVGPWHGFRLTASVAAGSAVMCGVAVLVNNLHPRTRYPTYWWGGGWPPVGAVAARRAARAARARCGGGRGGRKEGAGTATAGVV